MAASAAAASSNWPLKAFLCLVFGLQANEQALRIIEEFRKKSFTSTSSKFVDMDVDNYDKDDDDDVAVCRLFGCCCDSVCSHNYCHVAGIHEHHISFVVTIFLPQVYSTLLKICVQ